MDLPDHLVEALVKGAELTDDQIREIVTIEATELGLTYDVAVRQARQGTLPRNAYGSDIEMFVEIADARALAL